MINHRKVPYEISIGQRIAQIIFHKVDRLVLTKKNMSSIEADQSNKLFMIAIK